MNKKFAEQALAALIAVVISIPLTHVFARQIIFRIQDGVPYEDLRTEEQQRRAVNWRALRRMYAQAMRVYQELLRRGYQNLDSPDANDVASLRRYNDSRLLRQYLQSRGLHEAAPILEVSGISREERLLLRGYRRVGYCPESLQYSFVKGFYELCLSLVGHGAPSQPVRGIISDTATVRSGLYRARYRRPTLKLRLQVMEEAKKITRRQMQVPLRFKRAN